ncbi:hypothetical protein Tco_0812412 [Tanacetum coccineum]
MLLAQVQEAGIALSKEQLEILADTGDKVDSLPNCDDISIAKAVLMASLSSYGSDVLSEVPHFETYQNDMDNQSMQAMPYFEQTYVVAYPDNEITSDSNIIFQHAVIYVIDDEETLILEEISRSKMLEKQNDPISKEKKINTTPINYVELNRFYEDFGKGFVPQQELSVEQAFWLQTSHTNTDQSITSPAKIEAPMELPKVSLVNTSLKKLKYHLGKFDTMVKKRITPDDITEGEWGFEHTKKVFNEEVIPFKNSLQTLVKDFKNGLLNELNEVKTVFNQMEAGVDQCFVNKRLFEIEKKEFKLENEWLLEHIICQDVVNIVMHADVKSDNVLPVQNTFLDDNIALDVLKMENDRLMELLLSQDLVHTVVNSLAAINDYKSMERSYIEEYERNLKLAAEISLRNELSKTCSRLEQWFEQARISNPLDNVLAYACMDTKQIQELLVYVSDTCPSSPSRSEKLYFNPPPRAVSPDPLAVAASRAIDLASSPLSSTIDQDVPSASTSPTNQEIQS